MKIEKHCNFNLCEERKIDITNKKDIDFLTWIGLNTEENIKLIKEGNLIFFQESYAFEGCAVWDKLNNQCIVIDYRGA